MRNVFLLLLITVTSLTHAQSYFSYDYGNAGSNSGFSSIRYIQKHNAIFACGTNGLFAKFDLDGNILWARNTGTVINKSFTTTPSGGFIIVGIVYVDGLSQIQVTKTDSTGATLGGYVLRGVRLSDPDIIQALPEKDEYFIKGWYANEAVNDDIMLLKVNGKGKLLWQYRYQQGGYDEQTGGMVSDGAGGVYLSGMSIQGSGKLFWSHVNNTGDMDVLKYYGASFAPADHLFRTSDGGFIITGLVNNGGGFARDPFVTKLDVDGNFDWMYSYRNATISLAYGYSGNYDVTEDQFGNIYVTGLTGEGSSLRLRVMKITADGNIDWIKDGGESTATSYYQTSIMDYKKGGQQFFWVVDSKHLIDAGFGSNDLIITAEDTSFSGCLWTEIFPLTFTHTLNSTIGTPNRFVLDLGKSAPLASSTLTYEQEYACMSGKLHAERSQTRIPINEQAISDSLAYVAKQLYHADNITAFLSPNPADEHVYVTFDEFLVAEVHIQIADMSGRIVYQASIPVSASSSYEINCATIPEGLYLMQLRSATQQTSAMLQVRH